MESDMDSSPVFSIIVPVYNSEQTLGACLESLLQQTYTNFELLLIDDGSTDRSGQICDEYAAKDSRIRVFHTPNQGVSMARNQALYVARGQYVNFVDSDDWVTADYLMQYVEARKEYDFDLVYTEMVRVYEDGIIENVSLKELAARKTEDLADVLSFLLKCSEFGYTCNKSFKRDLIISNAIFFNKQCHHFEDALFTANYCLYIDSIKLDPGQTYYYRLKSPACRPDYTKLYLPTQLGCQALELLAERLHSEPFNKVTRTFNQEWLWYLMPYMYVFEGKVSKKDRYCYLQDLRYWFDSSDIIMDGMSKKGRMMLIIVKKSNIVVADLLFRLSGFICRIKSNIRNNKV